MVRWQPPMGLDVAIYGKDERKLASKRIGNVSQIAHLLALAKGSLADDSIIVSKVLYNGTHSGDSIGISELEVLWGELKSLSRISDAEMQNFARNMLEIVSVAREYGTAIQFV